MLSCPLHVQPSLTSKLRLNYLCWVEIAVFLSFSSCVFNVMVNLKQRVAGTGSAMFAKSTYSRWPLSSFYSHWPFFPVVSHCTSRSLTGQIFLGAGEAGLAYLFPPLAWYIVLELSWLVHPSSHGLVASHHTFSSAESGTSLSPDVGWFFLNVLLCGVSEN